MRELSFAKNVTEQRMVDIILDESALGPVIVWKNEIRILPTLFSADFMYK
jgi:hypothetical protein